MSTSKKKKSLCHSEHPSDGIDKDDLLGCVKEWRKKEKPRIKNEFQFYEDAGSLKESIKKAALAKKSNGKRHPHQRQNSECLVIWFNRLVLPRIRKKIRAADDFKQLISEIELQSKKVNPTISSRFLGKGNRIGELAIYDTAHRIGAYLGIHPERVYLHRGTREGARDLRDRLGLTLKISRKSLSVAEFPPAIQRLKAHEIEDFLCWYSH